MSTDCEYVTAHDLAKPLKLSPEFFWKGAKEGRFPHIRCGRAVRFPRREMEALLAVQPAEPDKESPPAG